MKRKTKKKPSRSRSRSRKKSKKVTMKKKKATMKKKKVTMKKKKVTIKKKILFNKNPDCIEYLKVHMIEYAYPVLEFDLTNIEYAELRATDLDIFKENA